MVAKPTMLRWSLQPIEVKTLIINFVRKRESKIQFYHLEPH